MLFVLFTTFAFQRGEPAPDIDSVFVVANLVLLGSAFVGITFFRFFFDIFASVGFVSLVFGFCRLYAGVQRGRAVGNEANSSGPWTTPSSDRWLAVVRLRFVPDHQENPAALARRRREYQRRLRRFLYAGTNAVMLEGVVERKTWLHEALSDLMLLIWRGDTERAAREAAMHDLARLAEQLAVQDQRLSDDGNVRMAFACVEVGDALFPRTTVGNGACESSLAKCWRRVRERPLGGNTATFRQTAENAGRRTMMRWIVGVVCAAMLGCVGSERCGAVCGGTQTESGRICATATRLAQDCFCYRATRRYKSRRRRDCGTN